MTTSLLHIYSSITMCFTNSTKKPWKCWELNTQTLSIWTPAITVYMPVGGGEKGAQQGVALLSLRPGGLCFGLTPERCHLWPGSAQFDAFKLVMEKKITKAKSPTRGIRGGRGLRPTLRRDILASLSGSYYVVLTYSRCLYWLVKNSSKDSTEFTFSLLYLARYHGGTCVSGLVNLRSSQCYELSHRS